MSGARDRAHRTKHSEDHEKDITTGKKKADPNMDMLMNPMDVGSPVERLAVVLDTAWAVFLARVASGRVVVNKESSMQLHYAAIVHALGETFCTARGETFSIELESKLGNKNADITCSLGDATAVLELKCFRKASNRATDVDMYDVLRDVSRLCSWSDFQLRRFICLTDNPWYVHGAHAGHAGSVTVRNGTHYPKDTNVSPSWAGQWKDKSRDHAIHIGVDITCKWIEVNGWYSLYLEV